MFGTIRRHQSWLWYIIVAFMIVSFVVYFNPSSRSGAGFLPGVEGNYGVVNGRAVTAEQFENARREYVLLFSLRNQRVDLDAAQLKYEIYQQLFLNAKEEELGIHPTAQAAAAFAREHILGNNISYDDFVEKKLKPLNLTGDDFDRFLRHEVASEQLRSLAGISGTFVTPGEAETLYRSEHRALVTKLAWFPTSSFLNSVIVVPADVAQFYTNEIATYRVPDEVVVNYVRFDASKHFAAAKAALTNIDAEVDRYYTEQGTNAFPDAKTPEEAKAKIKELVILQSALTDAEREAADFAVELDKRGNHAGDLEALAKEKGLTVRATAPFDAENGPADLKVPDSFAKAAFELTDDAPYRGDLVSTDAVYVIGLKQKIPSRIPSLNEINGKVTADYREMQAYQLAAQAATNFAAAVANELNVNNGVTLAKSFADICAEKGVSAETLPPFSLSTTNLAPGVEERVDLPTLKRAAFSTEPGSASRPLSVRDGSFVLYVEKMLPVDESQLSAELPQFLTYMREVRRNDAFNLWLNRQINQDPDLVKELVDLRKEIQNSAPAGSQSEQ
jgi:Tfp pilus assembly protein PilE